MKQESRRPEAGKCQCLAIIPMDLFNNQGCTRKDEKAMKEGERVDKWRNEGGREVEREEEKKEERGWKVGRDKDRSEDEGKEREKRREVVKEEEGRE